jgi:glycosyltransferase involved in cell wall biosynthesis
MRILHILEATYGGTRRHVLDLLPALQRQGAQCTLIYSSLRNPNYGHDAACHERDGVATFEIPMTRGWGGATDVRAARALGAHLQGRNYDVVHCHSTKAGVLGRLAVLAAAHRTPVVYTPHCLAFTTGLPVRQRQIARWAEKLLAPLTTRFIAVSRHERGAMLMASLCRPERASLIYNGIDLEAFAALPVVSRESMGLSTADFVIGCFGRLTPQKNPAALVRALPLVRELASQARLMLVGGGEEEAALRQLAARLRVDENIVWTGEIDDPRPLYALCDVVAQPSRWEGCPYSVLEAMAAGRPVVARRVGGVPELLAPGSGILYRSQQPHVAADHIAALAQDGARREEVGRAAHIRVGDGFRLDSMVQATLSVYRSVVEHE